MDANDTMATLLHRRRRGYSLERPFYTDPALYQIDLDLIWYRDWLFVGHDCEVPDAGSYLTVQIGEYPIIVLRDHDGRIRAFHNSCRHRGSRICTAEHGKSKRLVCPYHQWTYELDGRLLAARHMGEGFDKTTRGLKPVACESAAGYVFICLAEEPADFTPFRTLMEPYFKPHGLTEAKVAFESTIIEKGNWKLVWENNRECYHCAGSHPELCRTYPEAPVITGVDGADLHPGMRQHWARCESSGLPSTFQIDPAGQYRVTRVPLLEEATSYTMSGKAAVRRPLADGVPCERIGALLLYHFPSIWNHVLGDHAVTFRLLPLGAGQTALTTKWLVHREAVEGIDYDLETLTHVWTQTNDQDRRIVEENVRGVQSPAYEPGPYSERDEGGVIQFVDWYCSFIEKRLGDRKSPSLRSVA